MGGSLLNKWMVQLTDLRKKYEKELVVNNLSLQVEHGEFLTLLGPSGCGKTTTLRMIAGFEQPSAGEVWIDGKLVNDIPPYHRDVNTVFQNYALFPHMNVFDNVSFGLRMKKVSTAEIKDRVQDVLKMVQLQDYGKRRPDQLSGGQKQRVAIARALVNNPKVLLLDEPLGALDLKLRKEMQLELKHLQEKLGITFIYVTHDQEEALSMSDRIVVMNKGQIEQVGTPTEIYEAPISPFVASFIGESNLFTGTLIGEEAEIAYIELGGSKVPIPNTKGVKVGEEVQLAIRPERVKLLLQSEGDIMLSGTCIERIYVGSYIKTVVLLADGQQVIVHQSPEVGDSIAVGSKVYIGWDPKKAVVMSQ